MKVTFFSITNVNLGIEYLSANLKKCGFEVDVIFSPLSREVTGKIFPFFFFSEEEWAKKILGTNPDLIAFSSLSQWHTRNIGIARIIKEINPSVPIVFGGLHVSSVPKRVLSETCVDYVCVGEGEEALAELAAAIENKTSTSSIKNIWSKSSEGIIETPFRPLRENPDLLPFPDKGIFPDQSLFLNKNQYMIFSQMGCPFGCTFCFNSILKKRYSKGHIRPRPIEKVIEELKIAKYKYKKKEILFLDDTFNYNPERMHRFLEEYKKHINLPFFCQLVASLVDEKTVKALEEANCRTVFMGLQTLNSNLRKNILNCPGSRRDIKKAINLFKDSKIYTMITVMHDLPHQTDAELKRISVFLRNNPPSNVYLFKLQYYPKNSITDFAHKENILSDKDIEDIETCKNETNLGIGLNGDDKRLLLLTLVMGKCIPKRLLVFILKTDLYKMHIPFANFIKFIQSVAENIYLSLNPFKYPPSWQQYSGFTYMFFLAKFALKTALGRIKK